MAKILKPKLNPKKTYLQIALNSTLDEARRIINVLPRSDRIIVEAGTPLIKRYGEYGISQIYNWYAAHLAGTLGLHFAVPDEITTPKQPASLSEAFSQFKTAFSAVRNAHSTPITTTTPSGPITPYVVADLKTMDRAETEVEMAARAGASAAIALGIAPIETLNAFVEACEKYGLDPMIDMMNVEYPLAILHQLRKIPPVVIIHRGVDEERFNKEKQIPLHEIRRIKGAYDIMISIAGGDTIREVQRSVFNDADIVVIWKSVYESSDETVKLIEDFLSQIK